MSAKENHFASANLALVMATPGVAALATASVVALATTGVVVLVTTGVVELAAPLTVNLNFWPCWQCMPPPTEQMK